VHNRPIEAAVHQGCKALAPPYKEEEEEEEHTRPKYSF
jgi:hypothetical protein